MKYFNHLSNLFVLDEEPRNDDTEQRKTVVEYMSSTIPRNGINDDERRDDW